MFLTAILKGLVRVLNHNNEVLEYLNCVKSSCMSDKYLIATY